MLTSRSGIATARTVRGPAPAPISTPRSVRVHFKGEKEVDKAAANTKEAGQNVVEGVQGFFQDAKEKLADAVDSAKGGAEDAADNVKASAKDASRDVKATAKDGKGAAREAVAEGRSNLKGIAQDAADGLKELAQNLHLSKNPEDHIKPGDQEAYKANREKLYGGGHKGDKVASETNRSANKASKAVDDVKEDGQSVIESIKDGLSDAADKLTGKVDRRNVNSFILAGLLGGGLSDLLDSGKDKAQNVVDQAKNSAQDTSRDAKGFFSQVTGSAKDSGRDVKSSVNSAANDVKGATQDVASKAQDAVEGGFEAVKDSVFNVQDKIAETVKEVPNNVQSTSDEVFNKQPYKPKVIGNNI